MALLKPKKLKEGDIVTILSTSWGGPGTFPYIYEAGVKNLEEIFGLKVKEYPTTRMPAEKLYQNPQLRAKDINDAFADSEINGIISSIGGDDSVRILPYLDIDTIKGNPKVFMGFSDTSAQTTYINQKCNMVTFNGPSIMAGFAHLHNGFQKSIEHIKQMLFRVNPSLEYSPYPRYFEGFKDWANPENTGKTGELKPNTDTWHVLQAGKTVGAPWGGCMAVLEMVKGSPYWPDSDFWDGKILFLETSEEKPSVDQVKYWLRNYGMMGVLSRISGLLFGRARDYSELERVQLDEVIKQIVIGEFGRSDLPIISNVDYGHTDPQIIIPLGGKMEIDGDNKKIRLIDTILTE